MRLTSRWIETVRVVERTDFVDFDNPGLLLRVTPRGVKSWAYLYRRKGDGLRRMLTLGTFPRMGLKDAREAMVARRKAINDGADPAGGVQEAKKVETVDQMLDRYLKNKPPKSAKWRDEVVRIFNKDVRPAIGRLKVTAVTKGHIQAILNSIKDRGSEIAANRTQAALRRALNWAVAEGHIKVNPALGIEPRGEEKPRDRSLSEAEIRAFWTGLDSASMQPGTKLALRLALVTGQRIGEVCGAEQVDIDFDRAIWLIPAERSKNRREHSVPLSPMALQLFTEAMTIAGESRLVFPSRSAGPLYREQPLDPHGVAHAMRRELPELGLQDDPATPHDLRRTAASNFAAMGIPESIIARLLNHTSEIGKTITGRSYIKHAFTAEKRHAFDAWASVLVDIIEGRRGAGKVVRLQH